MYLCISNKQNNPHGGYYGGIRMKKLHDDSEKIKNNKSKKTVVKKIFKYFSIFSLVIILAVVVVIGGVYLKYRPEIVNAKAQAFNKMSQISDTTFKRVGNTSVLDKNNNLIAKIKGNDYVYTSLSDIPKFVQDGYIAVEDKDFLSHGGISYKGIARAAYLYIKSGGKSTQGGSTITQQLVKNIFLTQSKTIDRKITEIFLAQEIEKEYTKSQILEFYINNCYYGEGSYGIESASQHFFSKPAMDLTLAESATLCGLSNNPTIFSPTKNAAASVGRRNIVLSDMLAQGKITQSQYDVAAKSKLVLSIKRITPNVENYMTSYAIDCAVRALMAQDNFKFQYIFTSDAEQIAYSALYREAYSQIDKQIRSGGYTLYTSLDQSKQNILQGAVDNNLKGFTATNPVTKKFKMQGAAVSIDNTTGYVIAIVGGRGTTDVYNRAFLSFRQPGSSIKPVLDYAPAFELGYHPMSEITDKLIKDGPKNDENAFYGPVTMRWATEMSLNTVAYQTLQIVKPKVGLAYLGNMQYAGLRPEDNRPIASIGGFTQGVSPVEQAGGYYTLENQGYYVQPSCLKKMTQSDTDLVYENNRVGKQVYSPESAYMMTDILKGVISTDYGTGNMLKIPNQIVAGKTGTTSYNKDGWFVGYSAYYTTSVWCGYDNPTSVPNLYGATCPGNIWKDYMTKVHDGLPSKDFDKPTGIVFKNVDTKGIMTDAVTGIQDMFSQPLLDIEAAAKQAAWDANEPDRETNADNLLKIYESMHYTSRDVIIPVKVAYNEAIAAIQLVDSTDKQSEYNNRLQVHHDAIQPEMDALQAVIDKENADKAALKAQADADAQANADSQAKIVEMQKEQIQAESDADLAIKELETLTSSDDVPTINLKFNAAQAKTALVIDKSKHDAFVVRIATAMSLLSTVPK